MATPDEDLAARLAQVAQFEKSVRPGPVTRLLRSLGTTAGFAFVYRRIGPIIDPRIAHIRGGRFMAKLYGFPALLLHTTGAKSGQPRTSPLLYVRDGDDFAVIGTSFGQPRHPGWTANLRAHPQASVEIAGITVSVEAAEVDETTWTRLFPQFVAIYPGYENYLVRRGGLTPRMYLLHPSAI